MDRSGRSTSPRPPGEKPKPKGLLKEKLELEKIKSKDNGKPRYTIRRIEDTLSFDKGFYVFIRALQLLKSHNDGCIIVGIAGPSGSGKTAFTEQVRWRFWLLVRQYPHQSMHLLNVWLTT